MTRDWGTLDCPRCGATHPPPDPRSVENDDEFLLMDLTCPRCGHRWRHSLEIWRYYGIGRPPPSRREDR
jgi:uncharacterized C2H2 Zn-finger protein